MYMYSGLESPHCSHRPFFIALFRHLSYVGRRGNNRWYNLLLCRRLTLMCTSQGVTELLWNFANFFLGNVYFSCMRVHVNVTPGTDTYIHEYSTHTHTHTHTHTTMYLCSLDPDGDPLCALLMIDYHALRAGEYDFLINLFSQWEVSSQQCLLVTSLEIQPTLNC